MNQMQQARDTINYLLNLLELCSNYFKAHGGPDKRSATLQEIIRSERRKLDRTFTVARNPSTTTNHQRRTTMTRFIAARNKPMVIDREEGNLYDVNDSYDVARILGRLDGIYGLDRFDYATPEQVPHANPKGYIFDRTETRLIDMIREIEHLAQLLNGGGV